MVICCRVPSAVMAFSRCYPFLLAWTEYVLPPSPLPWTLCHCHYALGRARTGGRCSRPKTWTGTEACSGAEGGLERGLGPGLGWSTHCVVWRPSGPVCCAEGLQVWAGVELSQRTNLRGVC